MNNCIEENREEVPFIEENPEINFQKHLICMYSDEINRLKELPFYDDSYVYNKFQNLISQCQRKIDMITAFQVSQALKISLKQACAICKTT